MVFPSEVCLVNILTVKVRRICVEERFRSVIVWNQHLEALLFDNHISQTEGHLPDLVKQSADIKGLAGKAPSGAGVAVADSLQVVRCTTYFRIVRPLMHSFFQCLRPFLLQQRIDDFVLRFDVNVRRTSKSLKTQPLVEFLTGIKWQHAKIQQELCGAVADDTEAVYQLPIHIVVHLKVHGIMSQKHGAASAKDFNKSLVFLWEYGVKDRQ